MRVHRFLSLLVVFVAFSRAKTLFGYVEIQCLYTATRDVVYMEKAYISKVFMGEYNSTVGNYTGYTKKAMELADEANKNKKLLEQAKKNFNKCIYGIPMVFDEFTKPVEPTVKLKLVETADSKHPSMLVCSAYGFYPKHIQVSWLRDGNETTTDVTSTEELSNGNWLYQIHSYLEFTPKPGEKISCRVEHVSLMEPRVYDWELITEAEWNKYAVGTAGLLLGLLFLVVGLIFCKKNSTGRTLVPTR